MIIERSSFSKISIFKLYSAHTETKSKRFEKLRFRDGLVWTVGLTVEIKLRFQISLTQCGRGLRIRIKSATTLRGNLIAN